MFKKYYFLLKIYIYKRDIISFYKFLKKTQHWPKDKLEKYKFNQFKKILSHAYNNSPYYKNKYDDLGINIDDIKEPSDINKLPFLTKEDIKNHLESIKCNNVNMKNLHFGATGGSTGEPTPFYYDKSIPVESFRWRYMDWWGIKPWDNGVYLWRVKEQRSLLNKIAWWPTKKIKLDSTILNEKNGRDIVSKINNLKPRLIQGYIGAVYELALLIINLKIKVHSPKLVWVTSGPFIKSQREIIEKVFDSTLINEYGSSEIPWIAAQSSSLSNLHINDEGRYVEIVNKDNNGTGDIIITDLLNYSTPYIRYQIGDKAMFSKREKINQKRINLNSIPEVEGRVGDKIEIPNIGIIDYSYLTTIFDNYSNSIKGFQLVLKKDYSLILKVVKNEDYTDSDNEINKVKSLLEDSLQNKVQIKIDFVDKIKSDGGKTRFIINEQLQSF
jgi:phenylacetate-CoA ligase